MTETKNSSKTLRDDLAHLSKITDWFENQAEIDVEEGLKKVKEAVALIKASRKRLKDIENEFEEIQKEVNLDEDE
ncbi:MAG: exodeoxyribonuclease VII small subunit [Candidatus Nealsonbacteria bacterium]|nr:exodeoxyribonuclease VII small subunit [Candidatus Nealsonbacteria bacterium]